MVHKQAMFLLIFLFMSAENWGELQSEEISGSLMKLENRNELMGKKPLLLFLLKRKRHIKIIISRPLLFPLKYLYLMRSGRGNVQKSQRLANNNVTDSSNKQGNPTVHGIGYIETEDYVKRFLFTMFPDLKDKDAHWFVKLITKDVVKEMKRLDGKERRKHGR